MVNELSALQPLAPFPTTFFGGGNASISLSDDFNVIHAKLLAQKSSISAQSAKQASLQSQNAKRSVLEEMFANPQMSLLGLGGGGLFGMDGLFGLPSWADDAARLLGNPQLTKLITLERQAAFSAESRLAGQGFLHGDEGIFSSLV